MRLIDADALLQEFETENVAHNSDIWHITGIKAFIENQPTSFDIDKVVEQLEKQKSGLTEWAEDEAFKLATNKAIEIVIQEAEQYNNGWISCSERLPEGRQDVLVCFDNIDCCIIAWYSPNGRTWRNSSTNNICKEEPIAWMNLPAPYQPKGE